MTPEQREQLIFDHRELLAELRGIEIDIEVLEAQHGPAAVASARARVEAARAAVTARLGSVLANAYTAH